MSIRFAVLGTVCLAVLSGCSIFSSRKAAEKSADVETRDVPYSARQDDEAPRHRILVLPFLEERLEGSKNSTEVARQTVVRELLKTRQFVAVSLEDFPQDPKKFL